ncbi:MAG: efflux RND transporter permease subunit [Acidobacteriota bacterium]
MSLTGFAIEKNRITLTLVGILFVSGLLAFSTLPKAQDPGFTIRTAVVMTPFPGASPERVELLVTDKIEQEVQEMPELDNIVSESRTGISIVTVNFRESYKEMRPIFDKLRRKVEDLTGELPQGVRPPVVNDEFGDVFGSVYVLTGDGYDLVQLEEVAEDMRDRLLELPDVSKVDIHGTQQEVVFVEYENARLTELGLSPGQLTGLLSGVNIVSSGGDVVSGRERIALEPTGNFESVEDLRRTVVPLPSGSVVYLGDIVDVYRDVIDPPESLVRANGQPALAIAISLREGGDILALGEKLDLLMPQLEAEQPWGVTLDRVWFQAELVEKNVDDFVNNLLQAVAIVIVVMVLFLGLRTGFVVACLIPTTMIITFYLMQVFGITINQISLAALIIALGLLVDNAIVVVESILVKREAGMGAVEAAISAGSELKAPLLISSLTTAAAFMPIALAESAVGEYTADIFYVVTITLLVSWMLAMTFIPMLSTSFLKVTKREDDTPGRWSNAYRSFLGLCLRQRLLFVLAISGLFVVSILLMGKVPQVFIAPSEDPAFTGTFEMPLGTSIEASTELIEDFDRFVEDELQASEGEAGITNWVSFIGDGGPRFALALDPPNRNPANSFFVANASRGSIVPDLIERLETHARETQPDLSVRLARLENGPPVGYPVVIRISGDELEDLETAASRVTEKLWSMPEVTAVKNTWGRQTKKLVVQVDQERARRSSVTSDDVALSLRSSLSGIELTQFRDGDDLLPITLRSVAADRRDIGKLDGLSVYSSATGSSVPLKQVADVEVTFEPGVIERRNLRRTLSLKVQLRDGVTAADANAILEPWLEDDGKSWPSGTAWQIGGESEDSEEANASIGAKMPLALMAILLLLVGQFNSLRRVGIVLMTIPLGLIGVTAGLLIARSSFGFFTLLGIISLAGIIINNAIVLIDRIKIEQDELGKEPPDAVLDACQQRLRPILLTTATTVLGMMPLWWGGTAMFEPMAVSIIFGLAFATVLTLLVVPVAYSVLFRIRFR